MELALYIARIIAILFLFGFIVDWPEQRRKAQKRRQKQMDDCKNGIHIFSKWRLDYYIGYNDKDVYTRHCKHCNKKQYTISRLYPSGDDVTTYDTL